MQLVPRQIIEPDHLYDIESDSLSITVKHLSIVCSICTITKFDCYPKVIIKSMGYCCACISKLYLSLKTLKIKFFKLLPATLKKSWKNITTKIQKQVLLNQHYIYIVGNLRSYFDKYTNNDIINVIDNYINTYCQYYQKNHQLVTYQNIDYGIGILIVGKTPLCHHHINLGRNILPKLVPKTCQHI